MKVLYCGNTAIVIDSNAPICDHKSGKVAQGVYMDEHGELFECSKYETKGDSIANVRRSFGRLKALINCNYDSPEQVALCTLTYSGANMTDNSRLSNDLRQFFKKFRRRRSDFRYVYVKEKHARGGWHVHIIFFFDGVAPQISKEDLASLWGHGRASGQDWTLFSGDINNLGNYLTSMLTDHGDSKVKGSRLMNYESGIRLWNGSQDVRRPVIFDMPPEVAQRFIADLGGSMVSCRSWSVMINADTVVESSRTLYTTAYCNRFFDVSSGDNLSYVNYRRTTY